MSLVRSTPKWAANQIQVPGVGRVFRPVSNAIVTMPDEVAAWLAENGFVEIVGGLPSPPPGIPRSVKKEGGRSPDPPLGSSPPPSPMQEGSGEETWKSLLLEYLERSPAEEIIENVRGIGRETAEAIADLPRPLTWESVESVLKPAQIRNLKKFLGEEE
jgi:hypothetical protein